MSDSSFLRAIRPTSEPLGLFLRPERAGIVQDFSVAIAENVRREPAGDAEHPRLESGRDQRLHERLAGLEILAADGQLAFASEFEQRRDVGGQVRRAIRKRDSALE